MCVCVLLTVLFGSLLIVVHIHAALSLEDYACGHVGLQGDEHTGRPEDGPNHCCPSPCVDVPSVEP